MNTIENWDYRNPPASLIHARDAMNRRLFATRDYERVAAAIERQYFSILRVINTSNPFGPNNRRPCKAIVVVGAFRSGKSFIIEHALRQLGTITAQDRTIEPKAISVRCDPHFEAAGLAKSLLAAMQFLPPRPMSVSDAMERVRRRVTLFQPTAIHLDEFQRSLTPYRVSQSRILSEQVAVFGHVQQLLDHSTWPTAIILSGTHEISDALQMEEMGFLRERCSDVIELAPLKMGDPSDMGELEVGLFDYCKAAHVSPDFSEEDELFSRLTHAATYSRGMAFELCREAIEIALWRRSNTVTLEDFAAFYARKAGVSAQDNPFVAGEWHQVDTSKLLCGLKSQPASSNEGGRR